MSKYGVLVGGLCTFVGMALNVTGNSGGKVVSRWSWSFTRVGWFELFSSENLLLKKIKTFQDRSNLLSTSLSSPVKQVASILDVGLASITSKSVCLQLRVKYLFRSICFTWIGFVLDCLSYGLSKHGFRRDDDELAVPLGNKPGDDNATCISCDGLFEVMLQGKFGFSVTSVEVGRISSVLEW